MSLSRQDPPFGIVDDILNILLWSVSSPLFMPRVCGDYSAAIKIIDECIIWTDLSFVLMIDPTYASAHHSTYNSDAAGS